jgi:hypothetical protein
MERGELAGRRFRAREKKPAHSGGCGRSFGAERYGFALKKKGASNNLDEAKEMRDLSRSTMLVCFPIRAPRLSSERPIQQIPRASLLTSYAPGRQKVKRLVRVSLEQ